MKNSRKSISNIVRNRYFCKFILLDHDLNFEKKSNFTDQIINDIDLLKGKVKTYNSLTQIINEKYKTGFLISQIKYQADKLLKLSLGNAHENAYRFIELMETNSGVRRLL